MTVDRPTEEEVQAILTEEGLTHWSWFETGFPHENEAGIRRDGDGWVVYNTDERASEEYREHFDDEAEALQDFLRRARANTKYFRLRAERNRRNAEALLRGDREQ